MQPEPSLRADEGTEDTVVRILREAVGVDPERIRPDARLAEDLEIDSLDRIELVFELESAFGIEITDQSIAQVQTVQDIVSRIDAALGRGAAALPG